MTNFLSKKLFPGAGYFGTKNGDPLILNFDRSTSKLRLQLISDQEQILNLKGLELNNEANLNNIEIESYSQSSIYKNNTKYRPENLLIGKGIHTNLEMNPWWEISFKEPLDKCTMHIYNRRDYWGKRSVNLNIFYRDEKGMWIKFFDSQSADEYLEKLIYIAMEFQLNLGGKFNKEQLRETILNSVVEKIKSNSVELKKIIWIRVLPIINIWGSSNYTENEVFLLASRLVFSNGLDPLFAFSGGLKSRESIKLLQNCMNQVSQIVGDEEFLITRHGVQKSNLLKNHVNYLNAIQKIMKILDAAEKYPMLAYGTLLGAVRDKAFIPHDDDVDILYKCIAVSSSSLMEEIEKVSFLLSSHGFRVEKLLPNFNMHVYDSENNVMIDIFPCWETNSGVALHMHKMEIKVIDYSVLFPCSKLNFYDISFSAPNKPEAFLQERYGESWNISDQFFEWPWKLDD